MIKICVLVVIVIQFLIVIIQSVEWNDNWDKDPSSTPRKGKSLGECTAYRNIIYIRHGQCYCKGNSNKLSSDGREQSKKAGKRLKDLNIDITELIASTHGRAIETAKIISEYLPKSTPMRIDPDLDENYPAEPEPPVKTVVIDRDDYTTNRSFTRYFHRANATQEENSYTIIVGHANVIRYTTLLALQLDTSRWTLGSLYHTSMTWFRIECDGYVRLKSFGDIGFMKRSLMTKNNIR